MEKWVVIAAWLEAVGTILVFILALFKDVLWELVTKPRFRLSISSDSPDFVKLVYGIRYESKTDSAHYYANYPIYYCRMRVENRGARKAEHVQIVVNSIDRKTLDGHYVRLQNYSPLSLAWADGNTAVLSEIYPHSAPSYCNVAHIFKPADRTNIDFENAEWPDVDSADTILSLDTYPKPFDLRHLLPAAQYRLHLTTYSSNTKPMDSVVNIGINGKWYENEHDMRSQGFAVSLLA